MSLQIEQQETENRELKLTVRVDDDRVQTAMHKTAKRLSKNLRIPGFRPGKAPYHVVQNWIGAEALRSEAIDSITQDIYREATEQAGATPYAPGSLDDLETDPLVMHLTVPLEPVVNLGDYRSVRRDTPTVEVEDEAVNKALASIQEKHALLEPADRPAKEGDVVIADLKAEDDGDALIDREGAELVLDPDKLYKDTPFVENVVGMSAGDEKSFVLDMAAEGKEPRMLTFTVKVHEVKSRYLPPLNDDLAREEGDFESLLDLRIDVRKKLTEAAQREADAEYVDEVFDAIREGATLTYPPAAIEMEIDRRVEGLEERFAAQNWALDEMLKLQGKTRETLRDELRPEAVNSFERNQVTLALLREERLTLHDDELDQLIDERLAAMGDALSEDVAQQFREIYTAGQGRVMMANDALMNKFTSRLMAIGRGEAPELPELADEEE